MRYGIYDLRTGQIDRYVSCGELQQAAAQCSVGEGAITIPPSATDATHYINLETHRADLRYASPCVISKAEVPADGVTHTTLSRLRSGTQITITGPDQHTLIVNDGSLELTFTAAGRYTITVEAPFPALATEVTIDAT